MTDENEPSYSENELFDDMVDKDPAIEIVGYVESIEGRRQVKSYFLFKFVLTNGHRRITCLMWGDSLITKYQTEILIGRKICIDGAKSKACLLTHQRVEQNFVPFELIIQTNTIVTYYGQHRVPAVEAPIATRVTFQDIGLTEGLIMVEGFLKTVFTQVPSQYGNMSYGSGSITDGTFKIPVQVSNFIPVLMQKGQAVRVTGTVSSEGTPLRIECQTMADIVLVEDKEPMGLCALIRAGRTPRRRREE